MSHPPPKALIFDFDGLIVDTETPLYQSWCRLYQEHGHDLALETYVECVGSTTLRFDPLTHLQSLVTTQPELVASILEEKHRTEVRRLLAKQNTLPGVRERLAEAAAAGLSLAVASSSTSDWIDSWLQRLELTQHFGAVRTRDHVREAKPSPDLFLAAAEALQVAPEEALVFEDSRHGLQAARAAGMRCVVIPNAITRHSDFSAATLVLPSLGDLTLEEILARINPGLN